MVGSEKVLYSSRWKSCGRPRTNEKISGLVDLGFDLIEGTAVSASPHSYLRRRFRCLGGAVSEVPKVVDAIQDSCSLSSLLARARAASRAWSSRAKSVSIS